MSMLRDALALLSFIRVDQRVQPEWWFEMRRRVQAGERVSRLVLR